MVVFKFSQCGKNSEKTSLGSNAHNGGLSRLLPLRPAGPRGWQARPALCGPPPGTWPRLGVGGRCAGSLPASSSPLAALCGRSFSFCVPQSVNRPVLHLARPRCAAAMTKHVCPSLEPAGPLPQSLRHPTVRGRSWTLQKPSACKMIKCKPNKTRIRTKL
jgi:hypothetical protein